MEYIFEVIVPLDYISNDHVETIHAENTRNYLAMSSRRTRWRFDKKLFVYISDFSGLTERMNETFLNTALSLLNGTEKGTGEERS